MLESVTFERSLKVTYVLLILIICDGKKSYSSDHVNFHSGYISRKAIAKALCEKYPEKLEKRLNAITTGFIEKDCKFNIQING